MKAWTREQRWKTFKTESKRLFLGLDPSKVFTRSRLALRDPARSYQPFRLLGHKSEKKDKIFRLRGLTSSFYKQPAKG